MPPSDSDDESDEGPAVKPRQVWLQHLFRRQTVLIRLHQLCLNALAIVSTSPWLLLYSQAKIHAFHEPPTRTTFATHAFCSIQQHYKTQNGCHSWIL